MPRPSLRTSASRSQPRRPGPTRPAGLSQQWAALTWEEIARLPSEGVDGAILPVGATEQHGPHLGTGMDSCLADHLCSQVGARTGVPVLPLLPYGCSLGHSQRWPGTLALQPQTLIAVVTDIGDWLHASGFRRLFIVNSHVTNAAPLRCALEILRSRHDALMVAVINTATLSPRVARAFAADAADWHANAAETSVTLALAPGLVRRSALKRADDEDRTTGLVFAHPVNRTSTNGVTGFPSRASRPQGRKLFEWLVADLARLVRRGLRERPPLSASYFKSAAPE